MVEDGTIRLATADDVEFLTKNVYVSETIVRRKVELQEFVVALAQDRLVGLLQLEYLWSMVPYIALIRVLPDHRRLGFGRRMLGFVEELLYEAGSRMLYTSSQANEPEPQAWHRHVGFTDCGMIRGINDGIDEIFFCKPLSKE